MHFHLEERELGTHTQPDAKAAYSRNSKGVRSMQRTQRNAANISLTYTKGRMRGAVLLDSQHAVGRHCAAFAVTAAATRQLDSVAAAAGGLAPPSSMLPLLPLHSRYLFFLFQTISCIASVLALGALVLVLNH
jgi:hypothetical protein